MTLGVHHTYYLCACGGYILLGTAEERARWKEWSDAFPAMMEEKRRNPDPMYVRFLDADRYVIGFDYVTTPGIMWTSEQAPYHRRNCPRGDPLVRDPDSGFYPVLWEDPLPDVQPKPEGT